MRSTRLAKLGRRRPASVIFSSMWQSRRAGGMPARERDWRAAGRPAPLKAVQKCGTGEEPEWERSNGKALNFHA